MVGEVDVNGALLCQKKTDVYGISRGNVGTALSRHGFVGGLGHYSDDETGLIYMRARYYDPAIGRFISEDANRSGENWYIYCKDAPSIFVDEDGHIPIFTGEASAFIIWAVKEFLGKEVIGLWSRFAALFWINKLIARVSGEAQYELEETLTNYTLYEVHSLEGLNDEDPSAIFYAGQTKSHGERAVTLLALEWNLKIMRTMLENGDFSIGAPGGVWD